MLLLLNSLQRQRVVSKGVINVSKVRLVCDDFFSTDSIEELGPKFDASLVISKLHQAIISFLAVVGYRTFSSIRQSLVNESAQLKCRVILQRMVGRQSWHLHLQGHLLNLFSFIDDHGWPVVSYRVRAVDVTHWAQKVRPLAHLIVATGSAQFGQRNWVASTASTEILTTRHHMRLDRVEGHRRQSCALRVMMADGSRRGLDKGWGGQSLWSAVYARYLWSSVR